MSRSERRMPVVAGVALALLLVASGTAVASPETTEPMEQATVLSADLTVDGFDRYQFRQSTDNGTAGRSGPSIVVSSPSSNRGGNLRTVWWMSDDKQKVDQESCVTWSEFSGPIVQAGVALRVRRVGGYTQAMTVTNNILWGARNGWNVHLWKGGSGELIGQVVLSHSFGSDHFSQPPLPWRLCARVVGTTLEFKAWSLATHPAEPSWTDPGFGSSFLLPRGWVYPGHGGWYVGHLRPEDSTVYRSLRSGSMEVGSLDRLAIVAHAVADLLKRGTAAYLASGLRLATG